MKSDIRGDALLRSLDHAYHVNNIVLKEVVLLCHGRVFEWHVQLECNERRWKACQVFGVFQYEFTFVTFRM